MTTYTLTEIQIQSLLKKLERYQRKRQDFETFAEDIVFLINLQPNTQEPVGEYHYDPSGSSYGVKWLINQELDHGTLLYTHPAPQANPLTDEQIFGICENSNVPYKQPYFEVNRFTGVEEMRYNDSSIFSPLKFARAIEAAHGVKP